MSDTRAASRFFVECDPANPGQFFACCGLLELADRLYGGAEGWFEDQRFWIAVVSSNTTATLDNLLKAILSAVLTPLKESNLTTTPIHISHPFDLYLDWWNDSRTGGEDFKIWAGQQKVTSILSAAHQAMRQGQVWKSRIFQFSTTLSKTGSRRKIAPFYFDARNASAGNALDLGFSIDALSICPVSFPAVEFCCVVGLQRFRPGHERDRAFVYYTWSRTYPLSPSVASAVVSGNMQLPGTQKYIFSIFKRSDYYHGFLPAIRVMR